MTRSTTVDSDELSSRIRASLWSFPAVRRAECVQPSAGGVNFPETSSPVTDTGGIVGRFVRSRRGVAPKRSRSMTLQDWTQHAERGIKYYSGIATYRKSFEHAVQSGKSIYLDLGTVHDMARVTLNGKDLGVVWCAPWRVEITDAVKSRRQSAGDRGRQPLAQPPAGRSAAAGQGRANRALGV